MALVTLKVTPISTNRRSGPAALKLGSERFKELDANARAKYDKMYKEKLATYTEKLAAYIDAGGALKKNAKKKGKKKKKKGKRK